MEEIGFGKQHLRHKMFVMIDCTLRWKHGCHKTEEVVLGQCSLRNL